MDDDAVLLCGALMTELILDIPVAIDSQTVLERSGVGPGMCDESALDALIGDCRKHAQPKILYRSCRDVHVDGEEVHIDEVTFRSKALSRNLEKAGAAFAFVITCGRELDISYTAGSDIILDYIHDGIKAVVLQCAINCFNEHIRKRFSIDHFATINPGSGDARMWPIDQQRELFTLLGDVEKKTGVHLTDSFLMVPNKTVSGILFPASEDFHNCRICHRTDCPSRSAPFDRKLWVQLYGEETEYHHSR